MSITKPYAICVEDGCSAEFVDRKAMEGHQNATIAKRGNETRSHRARIVNPLPEEVAAQKVRGVIGSAISDATDRACEDFERAIDRGEVSEEALTKELAFYPDFSDAWDTWRRA